MKSAKVFLNGRSQAVRLPKEYRIDDDEVYVNKIGDTIVLIPKKSRINNLLDSFGKCPDLFPEGRDQGEIQEREDIL